MKTDPTDPPAPCITPKCAGQFGYINGVWSGARGLCKSCHGVANRLVRQRKTTWGQLEMMGLALSPVRRTPFMEAFELKVAERKEQSGQ